MPEAVRVAYGLCALANIMVAISAGADAAHFAEEKSAGHGRGAETHGPTLDDHIPAVGLGKPMDRTLWTLVWAVVAMIFQAMGLTYILGGEFGLPQFIRNMVDYVSGPTTFFVGATIGFVAMLAYWPYRGNSIG